jgi:hypothetical protein
MTAAAANFSGAVGINGGSGAPLAIKASTTGSDGGYRLISNTNANVVAVLQDAGDDGLLTLVHGGTTGIYARASLGLGIGMAPVAGYGLTLANGALFGNGTYGVSLPPTANNTVAIAGDDTGAGNYPSLIVGSNAHAGSRSFSLGNTGTSGVIELRGSVSISSDPQAGNYIFRADNLGNFYLPNCGTVGSGTAAYFNGGDNQLALLSSSLRFKKVVGAVGVKDALAAVLAISKGAIAYKSRLKNDDQRRTLYGVGAETMHKTGLQQLRSLVDYEDARRRVPRSFDYGRVSVFNSVIIADLDRRQSQAELEIARLRARMAKL